MKRTQKIIICSLTAALSVASAATAVAVHSAHRIADAAAVWQESSLEAVYALGENLSVPARTVEVGGHAVTTSAIVHFPSGKASSDATVKLNENGNYTVVYTAKSNGKFYVDEVSFAVKYTTVSFSSKSTATYETRMIEEYSYNWGEKRLVHKPATSQSGLYVSLAEGDSITFNQLVDVSSVTKDDAIVDCFVVPKENGVADFERLIITLTDSKDPSIYVNVSSTQSQDGVCTAYMLAGANGQQMRGYDKNKAQYWTDIYGLAADQSFKYTGAEDPNRRLRLAYDATDVAMHCIRSGETYIVDFNSPECFTKLWNGFPSGKVKVSISADKYNTQLAGFCVKGIGLAGDHIDLSQVTFDDVAAPEIALELDRAEMPAARVGCAYPVPAATAYDEYSGACKVKVNAWYSYGIAGSAVLMDIKDGSFVPKYAGQYALVYEAKDAFGNTAQKVVWVTAKSELSLPVIQATLENSYTLGAPVDLSDYVCSDGCGVYTVSITASVGGDTFAVGESFMPERVGTYRITYTVKDYIGQEGTAQYEFTTAKPASPVLYDTPVLPRYYINNQTYSFPEYYANDYSSGVLVRKLATVEITDSTGTYSSASVNSFKPIAAHDGDTVTVKFSYGGVERTAEVPVALGFNTSNRLSIANFFRTSGATATATSSNTLLTAQSENGGFTFANALVSESLSLRLVGVEDKSNYAAIEVCLTDSEDESIQISMRLYNYLSAAQLDCCGKSYTLSGSLNAGNAFTVSYANKAFRVGSASVAVTETTNGKAFDGFPSLKCYLSVHFVGAQVNDQIKIAQINTQVTDNSSVDIVAPDIVILGNYGGIKAKGSVVTLPAAIAGDTLVPNLAEFYVTVTGTDGKTAMKDVNGLELKKVDPTKEYTIRLDNYGSYKVSIYAKDRAERGASVTTTYTLQVIDDVAPVIKVTGKFQTSAKVGGNLVIPAFTVTDNCDAADDIKVMKAVVTSNGDMVILPDNSNSFTCRYAGDYELRIIAVDSSGNISMVCKTVKVS